MPCPHGHGHFHIMDIQADDTLVFATMNGSGNNESIGASIPDAKYQLKS